MTTQYDGTAHYSVDIVLCIDVTGSMRPVIDIVKKHTSSFYSDFCESMKGAGKAIRNLRMKVVLFRDLKFDQGMEETDFFELPAQEDGFSSFINTIKTWGGGGDGPESSLEAIDAAIKSSWIVSQEKQRNIIVLWTDNAPHTECLQEVTDNWNGMEDSYKRLLLFAPEKKPWKLIYDSWDNVIFYPSIAGKGLKEFEYKDLMNAIIGSI